jgi:hypothetical protein
MGHLQHATQPHATLFEPHRHSIFVVLQPLASRVLPAALKDQSARKTVTLHWRPHAVPDGWAWLSMYFLPCVCNRRAMHVPVEEKAMQRFCGIPGSPVVLCLTGDVAWCCSCGAHARRVPRALCKPCSGRHTLFFFDGCVIFVRLRRPIQPHCKYRSPLAAIRARMHPRRVVA